MYTSNSFIVYSKGRSFNSQRKSQIPNDRSFHNLYEFIWGLKSKIFVKRIFALLCDQTACE